MGSEVLEERHVNWMLAIAFAWATCVGFVAGLMVGLFSKPGEMPPAPPTVLPNPRADFSIDMKRISRN